ncbi:YggS family pyridoxal phosphate-dependent enzyme [Phormidesmis priestleyi ANT.L61.2]
MIETDLLQERIQRFRQTIPDTVRIIAVTKQVSVEAMRSAYAAGLRDFGENRIQEAEAKQERLKDLKDVTWHLIGHLQSNKAQRAIELFQWIQSVDSLKLAQRLDRLAQDRPTKPQICLQVKLLPDPHKSGWMVPELLADLPHLNDCKNLDIQGLMTIPPAGLAPDEIADVFKQTGKLAETIAQQSLPGIHLNQRSMGMSDDYLLAIQAGATMIRPGRILFGDRPLTVS